ncbi:hypothetical protein [Sphingomonas sp. LaA6.9]|uniref:hypothetical protein n=1 Tax=Sphingomonas sp. LaA6.9 TaxID=2919914 RepID=UPI001F5039E9|nr:hypothetical protein [Sphingomonas sp. LaA6.9]MCJ8156498.1 hypothetical protein [Sphingomonas sp. LaA6.9]
MATLADSDTGTVRKTGLADLIDRWIYVFTAALFLGAVLAGFVPASIGKIEAVRAGMRAPFPVLLHVHAVLMGSWILMLLTQTVLMATGRRTGHTQLGITAFIIAPALVTVGFFLVPTMALQFADGIRHAPPAVAAELRPVFQGFVVDIMLVQIRVGLLFAALIALALWARRRDAGLHKRLMILGTATAIPAATDRIPWLPTTLPDSPLTTDLWPLALLAPMFLWDLYRLRRIHKAWVIYLLSCLALAVPIHLLWDTPLWRETALRILGVSGV